MYNIRSATDTDAKCAHFWPQTRHCWLQTNRSAQCRPLLVQRTDRQADGGADRKNRQPHRWISAAAYRAVGRDLRCTGHGHSRGPAPTTSSPSRTDPRSLAEMAKRSTRMTGTGVKLDSNAQYFRT